MYFKDGVIVLTPEGTIVEVGAELETLLGISSLDLIDAKISKILTFDGFKNNSEDLIFGDSKRFELARSRGEEIEPVFRIGHLYTARGRVLVIKTLLEPAGKCPVGSRSLLCLNLFYSTLELPPQSSLNKLPAKWANLASVFLNLWVRNKALALIVVITLTLGLATVATDNVNDIVNKVKILVGAGKLR
jgi:hypothetical protein